MLCHMLLFRVNIKMAEDSKNNGNEDSATEENKNSETVKNGGETVSVSDIPDHIKFKESLDFTITKVKVYLNIQWIKI